jgi:hypothetical protein
MTTRTRRRVSFTSAATAVVVVAGLIGLVVLFGPGHGPFSPRQVSPTAQAGGPNGHKPSPSPGGQPARLKGCVDPVTANPTDGLQPPSGAGARLLADRWLLLPRRRHFSQGQHHQRQASKLLDMGRW